jgi:hypothetical protein
MKSTIIGINPIMINGFLRPKRVCVRSDRNPINGSLIAFQIGYIIKPAIIHNTCSPTALKKNTNTQIPKLELINHCTKLPRENVHFCNGPNLIGGVSSLRGTAKKSPYLAIILKLLYLNLAMNLVFPKDREKKYKKI